MMKKNEIYQFDFFLILVVASIVILGILTIYSAGFDPIDKINNGMYKRQLLWFIIGFILMIGATFINYNLLGEYSIFIYGGFLFILIVTTVFSTPVRGISAWINFGFFSIQPSEFMKLATIIILAKYIEIRDREIKHFRELLIPSLLILVPIVIIVLQPDLGTAMIFIPVLFAMLFVGGADVTHIVSIISISLISILFPVFFTLIEDKIKSSPETLPLISSIRFWKISLDFFNTHATVFILSGIIFMVGLVTYILHVLMIKKYFRRIYIPSFVVSISLFLAAIIFRYLMPYQKERILVFLNPDRDPTRTGYNVIQSKIAIGSGGFLGKGFMKGSQSQLGFLPEKTSDFIFAVFAEEWGFLGTIILITLLFIVVFKGLHIAMQAKDRFAVLLATGITSIFFFHMMINIGMAMGIVPVTGLPLPFVSYGGSNMLMAMISIGILINIRMRKFVN